MFDLCNNKFPIVVLSAPRTGSTALAYYILECYKEKNILLEYFGETLVSKTKPHKLHHLENCIDNNKHFLFKSHLWDLLKFYPDKIINLIYDPNVFLIRIRRKNFVNQVVSWCIESRRNVWGYNKETSILHKDDIIDIDYNELNRNISYLKLYNKILNNMNLSYDLDVYYEDYDFSKLRTSVSTPKPSNYNFIQDVVEKMVDKYEKKNNEIIPKSEVEHLERWFGSLTN